MRFWSLVFALLFLTSCSTALVAQEVLFQEKFNDCSLPIGWEVKTTGNPNPLWYVTDGILNNDDNGQSMNGSCFLFIDDDGLGDNTPAYVIDFVSPPFDASKNQTVQLSVDVHYRDWASANEYFAILVTDGVTETEITRFDRFNQTGDTISEIKTVTADLSVLTQSKNARLIFRYDDAGGFNWWAGFDNVMVKGLGVGTNLIAESFNGCAKPAGWETEILTGDFDWSFGKATNPKAANGNSINGSCFAYFDDDILGDSAAYSSARLYTPWFDGTIYGRYYADFDFILRYYSEVATVYVQKEDGSEYLVGESGGDIGGPLFSNSQHFVIDISAYRDKKMRLVFQYDDGNRWAWWAGVDNIKIVGDGVANDLCINASSLLTGDVCKAGNNLTAVFDGPPAECTSRTAAGVWYSWQADFTGKAKFSAGADFNDVVNIYTGGCTTPQSIMCNNRDEHGFTGESTYFDAQAGNIYLIRVSGTEEPYGVGRGNLCARLEAVANEPTKPANDACENAANLTVDGPCVSGTNRDASMSAQLPSLNQLARADVWYRFTAPPALAADQVLQVQSNADFSDIITLYAGGCNSLTEIAGNHHGRTLDLPALTEGQEYFVQIAGNFASVEGQLCPQILVKQENAPINDNCVAAKTISLNGQCTPGTNVFAGFSGNIPPCVPNVTSDVWYKFTATASGAVRINTGAQFEHVMAVWSGDCSALTPVFCADNPKRCDGFALVGNLTAGQEYYIQIASKDGPSGIETGDFCLKVLDAALQPEFVAMELQVEEDCNSLSTAAIKIKVNGGMQPYTFEGTQNNTVLNSGDAYLVVVTDAIGCEKSWVGVVDNCAQSGCTLVASITQQYPLCHSSADGSLSINAAGGTPPYTYSWSNGAQAESITGLTSGTYGLTIQDALGCDINLAYVLNSPDPILVAPVNVIQPTAGLNNGAIYVDVIGGAGLYNYAWLRNGVPFVNAEDLTDAPGGDYTLLVTDANGCTASLQYTLTETVGSQNPTETVFAEIFPNPAKDKATMTLVLPKQSDVQWSIVDGAGKTVRQSSQENVLDQDIPLDVKDLSAGAYLVKIVVGEAVYYRKLVIGK